MRRQGWFPAAVLIAAVLVATPVRSQPRYPPSQRGSVTQSVAFTTISVTYGRPVARGRELFGALVPWDNVWHPGADSATVISFSHDVQLNGQAVPAGEYSLWLIPRASAPWTLIVHKKARAFHRPYPGADGELLRSEITPETGAHMESLMIYFPAVQADEATMRIHWGTTIVPVQLKAPWRPPGGAGAER